MKLKLTLGAREYVSDVAALSDLSIGELRTVKRETGMSLREFGSRLEGFGDMDPEEPDFDLIAVMVYLLRRRSGDRCTWADVENVPLSELKNAFSALDDEPAQVVDVPLGDLVIVGG